MAFLATAVRVGGTPTTPQEIGVGALHFARAPSYYSQRFPRILSVRNAYDLLCVKRNNEILWLVISRVAGQGSRAVYATAAREDLLMFRTHT